jgi:serine/threonine-protein kinase RIO1/membrane-associated phospholipid phosphatase
MEVSRLPTGARPAPVVTAGSEVARRRRRPSGEPPPLPREAPGGTRWYAAAVALTLALEIAMAIPAPRRWLTAVDDVVLRALATVRTGWLTSVLRAVGHLAYADPTRVLAWATIAVLLLTRHFRQLLSYLAMLLLVAVSAAGLALLLGRMRPTAVSMLAPWRGYAHPSVPVAVFAAVVGGAVYTAVPTGHRHRLAAGVATTAIAAVALARLYLGIDHPTDVLAALGIGGALPILGYRLLCPHEAFPVRYRRGRTAHLELSAARTAAILEALDRQLGIRATAVAACGLDASAGSTPLRIRRADGSAVFGKLYALNHLRSDRSYKFARMMLYGRLEDEKPFATVRRLVEYEDHMLRLLRDAGLPVPAPLGIVEITPEREYVVVMDFVAGAKDLGARPATVPEIDAALAIVQRLWHAGVAHRDIKPSNLLVRDDRVWLIDVAFAALRPTPWRQAVDLANMMLSLALASDAALVYQRAVRIFAPDDVGEAFAASRSVTIPTQLRARLRADGRDLLVRFRELAPARPPVPIQVWSVRRMAGSLALLVAVALAGSALYGYARVAGLL